MASSELAEPIGDADEVWCDNRSGLGNKRLPTRGSDRYDPLRQSDGDEDCSGCEARGSACQDFEVVATAQTVESDAERIAANRAKYIVMDVQALPRRPGRRPNVVDYALRTNNPIGVQLYNRFATGLKVMSFGGCDRYRSKDEAQQDFLAKGGPERDAYGLDPDGDGFACGWDPRPFRLAVAN
ncbi:hypothetical protein OAX13_04000 [Planktomarina temperata]|nr:hypothetical protein [Planktomarina temperata]